MSNTQTKLTPFELEVKQECDLLFENIKIADTIPFPKFQLKTGLFLQVIQLSKLTPELDLTFFEKLSIKHELQEEQILFLWEDQWIHQKEIVRSRLQSFAGQTIKIHGRETRCQRIDKKSYIDFLTNNHLQVPTNAKFKYGLFKENKIVAIAGFSSPRKYYRDEIQSKSSELIRFCNLKGHTVIGGFDKILKYFINEHDVDDIMSYADRDWSNGHSYEKLGFSKISNTPASSFWIHQKDLIRIYPHLAYTQLGSDDENELLSKGYQQIVNSGNIKYIKFL